MRQYDFRPLVVAQNGPTLATLGRRQRLTRGRSTRHDAVPRHAQTAERQALARNLRQTKLEEAV